MNDLLLSMDVYSHIKKHEGQGHFTMIYHRSLLLNMNTHIMNIQESNKNTLKMIAFP